MKNILVMGCVGVGLFSATVAALLGAQGRLNYEGTRHIPLLSSLFDAPEGSEVEPAKPKPRPKPPVVPVAPPRDEVMDDPAPEDAPQPAPPSVGRSVPAGVGELFDLRHIEASGLTVDEVNGIVERARFMHAELLRERAELHSRQKGLEERERDIEARQAHVLEVMQQVREERSRIEQLIEDFNARVAVIEANELPALRQAAATIAKLTPEAGADLVLEFWREKGGKDKVVKLLTVMDVDRADEIIGTLDAGLAREILERRMLVVPTVTEKKRRRTR